MEATFVVVLYSLFLLLWRR